MSLIDSLGDQAKDYMKDPNKREQIEQLAKEKGITVEQAANDHMAKNNEDSK